MVALGCTANPHTFWYHSSHQVLNSIRPNCSPAPNHDLLRLGQAGQIAKPLHDLPPLRPSIFDSDSTYGPIGSKHRSERSEGSLDDDEIRHKSFEYLIHRACLQSIRHFGEATAELHEGLATFAKLEHPFSPCDELGVRLVINREVWLAEMICYTLVY